MNGQELKFLKEMFAQTHEENLAKFEKIFNKLDELPCDGHKEKLNTNSRDIKSLVWFLASITILVVGALCIKAIAG